MNEPLERVVMLSESEADFVDRKAASGAFETASDVIHAAVRTMMRHDQAIETWLREAVLPTLKVHDADPSRARVAEQAFAELEAEFDTEDRDEARKSA